MALREDRQIHQTNIDRQVAAVSSKGGCLVAASTAGFAEYVDDPSGIAPLGILLDDVVDRGELDDGTETSRFIAGKVEVGLSGVVAYTNSAELITDQIDPAVTVADGETAYIGGSGLLSNVAGAAVNAKVGTWITAVDTDGFAKLRVELG